MQTMNDYRIIFEYKGKQITRIVNANCATDANTKFLSKIKQSAINDIKLIDTRLIEPVTRNFSFDNETVATFLQWYLDQLDADEYELNCHMEGKKFDENAKSELQALQDFIKGNYLTNIQIAVTGDKK